MLRRACALAQTRQSLHFMPTPVVKVYVSQTKTRNLAYLIAVHALLIEAISEGSGELAHWHRLARAYTLCIHQV